MNSLSWFLYIGDVAETGKGVFGFLSFALPFAIIFYSLFNFIDLKREPPHIKKLVALLIVVVLTYVIIPKSRTIYMIAASEAGQQIAQTEDGKEMIELVKSKIKDTLKSDR